MEFLPGACLLNTGLTAVFGNNLMKEINEKWDCQQEMIPNHFCVILDKNSFSEAKLLGFYGKISKKSP